MNLWNSIDYWPHFTTAITRRWGAIRKRSNARITFCFTISINQSVGRISPLYSVCLCAMFIWTCVISSPHDFNVFVHLSCFTDLKYNNCTTFGSSNNFVVKQNIFFAYIGMQDIICNIFCSTSLRPQSL